MTFAETDVLIIGGGLAGISLAASIAGRARVLLIEQEAQPAYHATGRSVAFWAESYGGLGVQPLTTASGPMLAAPDPDFSKRPLMTRRGAIHIGRAGDEKLALQMRGDLPAVSLNLLDGAELSSALPGLRPDWTVGLAEPSMADIDVAALLQAYRTQSVHKGVTLSLATRFLSAQRDGEGWRVTTASGEIRCAIIVNAAGAWADSVARSSGLGPLGITPYRRTVVQLRCPEAPKQFPLVLDLGGNFYFKPEGIGRIWLSPHDETPDSPRDVAPEELDVALAIDRFQRVVGWRIEAVERKWAGLRSFAPDRSPVYGFDPRTEGFFWFAGQGGFGIQTAPAAALLAAALLLREAPQGPVAGIDPQPYLPDRLI